MNEVLEMKNEIFTNSTNLAYIKKNMIFLMVVVILNLKLKQNQLTQQ